MDSETVRERLEELGEELQTVASLVHASIKNQQQEGVDEAGAFDCSGDSERKFQVRVCCVLCVVCRRTYLETGSTSSSTMSQVWWRLDLSPCLSFLGGRV